jgi:hypothetical protein
MLIEKNRNYGNSALEPINIFNKSDAKNSILVRLDDKLQRVKNSKEIRFNDISDLMGYLALYCVNEDWLDPRVFID